MLPTKLLYLEDMQCLTGASKVLGVLKEEEKVSVILDESYFYPQGGGQPYDQGIIKNDSGLFKVEEVRFIDNLVHHIGHFESGEFKEGNDVHYEIDEPRRKLHTRLHSGGHLIDMALHQMGIGWKPGKGYHFPDGAYVEYEGDLEGQEKEDLMGKIETIANSIITKNGSTTIEFMPKQDMHTVCHNVPDYLPEGKPTRVVSYGDFGEPCGGTHGKNLADIQKLTVRKIKAKGGKIKVGYDVERN